MNAQELIGLVGDVAAQSGLFEGLFLVGSFGKGTADRWSDVDLVGLVPADQQDAAIAWWQGWLAGREHLIYFKTLARGGRLANAITESWLRVDLNLPPDAHLEWRPQDGLRALYDPSGLLAAQPVSLPAHRPDPARIEAMVIEFLRILGLTPVGLGREEWVVMAMGTGMLRDMVSQLMQEELPIPDRGGMLHLSRLLPEADMVVLLGLPYPAPERVALLAAQVEIARVFLPRARALSARIGASWPHEFETAVREHLAGAIGQAPEALWSLA